MVSIALVDRTSNIVCSKYNKKSFMGKIDSNILHSVNCGRLCGPKQAI
jgi:hypothetical protein